MWDEIQNAFSASSLAALRNVLTALAVFIGALGVAGLTQSSMQNLVDDIMSVGTAAAGLITAISVLVAAAMPIIAWAKSTLAAQRKSVSLQLHTMVVQTSTPADALKVAAAIATMPEVKQVTASPRVAYATENAKVVAAVDSKDIVQLKGN